LALSLSGVVFGVAIFICTQAQTQGLSRYFIESNIGSNGASSVRSRFRPALRAAHGGGEKLQARYGPPCLFEGITIQRNHAGEQAIPDVVSCSPVLEEM